MRIKLALALGAATTGLLAATPASALTLGSTACALTDISPAASACGGWYTGNLNSSSPADKADQAAALNALLGVSSYTASNISWLEDLTPATNTIDFAAALYGQTVVSFHVGAANGQTGGVGYNGTAFYVFNAGNVSGGLNTFGFARPGLSNARLYSTGRFVPTPVPESATWMMMIVGFGGIGAAMRRRTSRTVLA